MALCPRQRTLSAVNRVGHQEDTLDSADFDALEEKARAGLSPAAYAFAAAGADDEITAADNIAAKGVERDKMVLIPNLADVPLFDAATPRPDYFESLGLGRKFVAIYAGAMGQANGVEIGRASCRERVSLTV